MAGAPDDVGLLAMAAGAQGAGGRVRPAMPRPSPRAEILRAASGEFRTGPPRGAAADREPVDDLFALALGGLTAGVSARAVPGCTPDLGPPDRPAVDDAGAAR